MTAELQDQMTTWRRDLHAHPEFGFEDNDYSTIAGYILSKLHAIPNAGDHFVEEGYRFEVIDMDKSKIDKVLVTKIAQIPTPEA